MSACGPGCNDPSHRGMVERPVRGLHAVPDLSLDANTAPRPENRQARRARERRDRKLCTQMGHLHKASGPCVRCGKPA